MRRFHVWCPEQNILPGTLKPIEAETYEDAAERWVWRYEKYLAEPTEAYVRKVVVYVLDVENGLRYIMNVRRSDRPPYEATAASKYIGYADGKVYDVWEVAAGDPTYGKVMLDEYHWPQWCRFTKIERRDKDAEVY